MAAVLLEDFLGLNIIVNGLFVVALRFEGFQGARERGEKLQFLEERMFFGEFAELLASSLESDSRFFKSIHLNNINQLCNLKTKSKFNYIFHTL